MPSGPAMPGGHWWSAAERLTDWVDPDDRSVAIIFGDGAGAALVGEPVDGAADAGIGPVAWGSDGAAAGTIQLRARESDGRMFLGMEGSAVFRWATTQLTPVARRACELACVAPEKLDAIVFHQANLRITESIARSLGSTDAVHGARHRRIRQHLRRVRSRSRCPGLIDEGQVGSGDAVLLFAFGAGLTYAGQVVRLP